MSINVKQNGELTKIAGLYQTTAPIGMADCYSTEEKIVGCWTDGKPIYECVYDFNSISLQPSPWYEISIDSSNIDTLVNGVAYNKTWTLGCVCVFKNDSKINVVNLGSSQLSINRLILKYTKTTDTPGSGQWTPSGDIAKHYSTEEQVIGTWIDGSTLYETTVSWPSITAGGNTLITLSHGISNIAKVINFDFIFGSDSYKFKTIPLTDPAWFAMVSAVTQASVQYRLGTSYSSYGLTMTIQYTKTTD